MSRSSENQRNGDLGNHAWPRFSLRTAMLAITVIACTVAVVSSNEHYFASMHANIENKLGAANARISELTQQKRQHRCPSRICGTALCGTTNNGPPALMGACKWTERTERELIELQAESAVLKSAQSEAERDRSPYRVRCGAVVIPVFLMFIAAYPLHGIGRRWLR